MWSSFSITQCERNREKKIQLNDLKKTFENLQGKCTCPPDFPKCICGFKSYGKVITKKPIVATDNELELNPRSRSAKLRVFERR